MNFPLVFKISTVLKNPYCQELNTSRLSKLTFFDYVCFPYVNLDFKKLHPTPKCYKVKHVLPNTCRTLSRQFFEQPFKLLLGNYVSRYFASDHHLRFFFEVGPKFGGKIEY